MATVVKSFAIQGIDGYLVDIEVKMLEGQPMISIIGLGGYGLRRYHLSDLLQPGSKTENGIPGIGICKDPDRSCQWNGQRNRQLCTYCMSQFRWLYNSNIRKWPGYLLSK